jgi:BirA family biotin operon repressor/biotin-[acetyl-CoA-carboxylase] ligase
VRSIRYGFWEIEWYSEIASTMDRARDCALAGHPGFLAIVADFQSRGRGSGGRIWVAASGSCLMFTVLGRPQLDPRKLETFPLRIASVVATELQERLEVCTWVKPPNDIMIGDRKLCGVLCNSSVLDARVDWITCGVGLNTFMTANQRPVPDATSLVMEGYDPPGHESMLEWFLDALEAVIK